MYDEILNIAYEYLEKGEDLELVEIIKSSSSGTPRKEGAFMFVNKNKESFGTIGGGNVEYQATLYAKSLLDEKKDGEKIYDLSQKEAANIGMVCGGDNNLKFTYLTNDEKSKSILSLLREKNKSKHTVFIFGAGHVGMELTKILHYVGFEVVVWDDRENFANVDRFPFAKSVVCKPLEDFAREMNISDNDFVVIMTRGHVLDYEVEKLILKTQAAYIGVIGSSSKTKVLREKLLSDGYSEEDLNNVCTPIGLPIGADTPEEIAVAIAGELILFRARREKRKKVMDDNKLINFYVDRGIRV